MTPARLLSSLSSKAPAIARPGPAHAASAAAAATGNSSHITTNGNLWWAAGGWIFFVAENALLSENRAAIIAYLDDDDGSNGDNRGQPQGEGGGSRGERSARARGASSVGDDRYHLLYGIASTAATASIGYSYYRLRRAPGSAAAAQATKAAAATMAAAWACLSGGWALALQAAPKMQVPVSTSTWQVRCPFDFTDSRREAESQGEIDVVVRGLERITRHPGLWSLALVGAGQALLSRPHPVSLWWCGPSMVALLGGWHHDSRFRRGIGGRYDPLYESQTSNVPLAALLTGRQGPAGEALRELLARDVKPLNAGLGVAVASAWVYAATRGRARLLR